MALVWQNIRRIFWINFNKPQRKLGLILRGDGIQVAPRGKKAKQFQYARQERNHRPFLAVARKHFSQTYLLKSNAHYRHILLPSQVSLFHTTRRLNIPPVLWTILKPLGKLWAMLWGRYIRRWWTALPLEKRTHYKGLFGGMKGIIFGVVFAMVAAAVINYVIHLERNPLTNRLRFISLSKDQISSIVEFEEQSYLTQYKDQMLTPNDPIYKGVVGIASNILAANKSESPMIQSAQWKVTVVDDLTVSNAFVLPNGHIFVFTGLINDIDNVDQLAIVMGHEIAHAIMGHSIEHVSRGQLLDVVMIFVLAAIWTFVPGDGIAVITQWFYNKLMKLMMELPYSRELEMEADKVGLLLAAKACYDVREAPALWAWQEAKVKLADEGVRIPELLSTHPANESRTQSLQSMLPAAIKLRESCSCAKLDPSKDPWVRVANAIENLRSNKEKLAIEPAKSDAPV